LIQIIPVNHKLFYLCVHAERWSVPMQGTRRRTMAKKIAVKKAGKAATPSAPPARGGGHPLLALREQMDRLFDEFLTDWRMPSIPRGMAEWEAFGGSLLGKGAVDVRFDVSETDDAIALTAELPGIDEKDVELTLSDGMLTVKGEKKAETEKKEKDYYLSERRYGSFLRSMRVPESVDEGNIKATFEKGVLKVAMPKRAEAKAKKKKIAISKL